MICWAPEHAPVVQRRVVAEPREQVERARVVVGRGVEVQLRVRAPACRRRSRSARSGGCRSPCGRTRPRDPPARSAARRSGDSGRSRRAPCAGRSGRRSGRARLCRRADQRELPLVRPPGRSSPVSCRLRARLMCIPSSDWPVWARICVSPEASAGSRPAITFGRPALSTNTSASRMLGSMFVPATAWSIRPRHAATRAAVASAPPGLLTNRTCALPAIARATKSDSRLGHVRERIAGLGRLPDPGKRQRRRAAVAARGGERDRAGDQGDSAT